MMLPTSSIYIIYHLTISYEKNTWICVHEQENVLVFLKPWHNEKCKFLNKDTHMFDLKEKITNAQ